MFFKGLKIWWFSPFFPKSVLGNLDPYSGTLTRTQELRPILRNLDPYSGTLKLIRTRLCTQVHEYGRQKKTFNILKLYHRRQFAMSHGSNDSNLGSKRFILVGDIRSRSWPNIRDSYGTFDSFLVDSWSGQKSSILWLDLTMVHVALPKRLIIQLNPCSAKQTTVLRAYCPIYIVL